MALRAGPRGVMGRQKQAGRWSNQQGRGGEEAEAVGGRRPVTLALTTTEISKKT